MEKLGQVLVVLITGLIVALLIAFPILWLWNSCLVLAIPALVKITYWQAFGIRVLFSLLFSDTTSSTSK